jgi:hypothetical protein
MKSVQAPLIHDDRIDLVTIAVKLPAHREFVLAALSRPNCSARAVRRHR